MPDHSNDPDYQWKPAPVPTLHDRVNAAWSAFVSAFTELANEYGTLARRVEELESELREIKAKGYGALHADELRAAGHRPWLHGDEDDCWCWVLHWAGAEHAEDPN